VLSVHLEGIIVHPEIETGSLNNDQSERDHIRLSNKHVHTLIVVVVEPVFLWQFRPRNKTQIVYSYNSANHLLV